MSAFACSEDGARSRRSTLWGTLLCLLAGAALGALGAFAGNAAAQTWPAKPIRLVVPFPRAASPT
ncbi:MAG: hypothetical protein MO847_05810 [Candidatus Protistobacter heckmanni]|nr:hypothetical protein [Candidatus Protistobacter heckmanni]